MVLCRSLSVRAFSLFQLVQCGVQMVGSELNRSRGKRGEKTKEDFPFSLSGLPPVFISSSIFRLRFLI